MSDKLQMFFNILDRNNIEYCCWKSTVLLKKCYDGTTDLDILVNRRHKNSLDCILADFNFKRATPPYIKQFPGIEDYLGYDDKTDILIHLHLHYSLVMGKKYVKNHLWNIENYILQTAVSRNGVKTIDPNLEIVILYVRSLMKLDFVDVIKWTRNKSSRFFPDNIVAEYRFLLGRISKEKCAKIFGDLIGFVEFEEFWRFVCNFPNVSVLKILRHRFAVLRGLSRYRRNNLFINFWKKVIAFFCRNSVFRVARVMGNKRRFDTGGLSIAILGSDGSGKSSVVDEIGSWLSNKVGVSCYYFGSGCDGSKFGLLTLERLKKKIRRKVNNGDFRNSKNVDRSATSFPEKVYKILRVILITKQRWSVFKKSTRKRNNGFIVVYDRYPQIQFAGLCDGPKGKVGSNGFEGLLSKWEIGKYLKMTSVVPDVNIILDASPDLCLERKPDHRLGSIKAKVEILKKLNCTYPKRYILVDGNQSLEGAVKDVKKIIWKSL